MTILKKCSYSKQDKHTHARTHARTQANPSKSSAFVFFPLQRAQEWQTVFWVTFLLYAVGTLAFCLLISADRQQWDKVEGVSREVTTEAAITPR